MIETFVNNYWQMVFLNELGVRVEGDPRIKIRKRVSCMFWQEGHGEGSITEQNYEGMDDVTVAKFKEVMRGRGGYADKREWMEAMRGRWGLMSNSSYEDESCRLCEQCVFCNMPEVAEEWNEEGWNGGCAMCAETIHHVVHTGCTEEMRRLYNDNLHAVEGNWQA